MPITLAAADLSNGVRLPYAEHGAPDGTPVVLLHGITDSWRAFEPVLPHLPDSIHAYSLTARGHGDASRPGSYRLDDMVDDVARFLDAVGLDAAIVAGHSMGAVVATRFAIDHPDRTAGLVIMGGRTTFAGPEGDAMTEELAAMTDPIDVDYLRGFQESTLARPIPPDYLDLVVSESAKLSIETFRRAWSDTVLRDFSADLGAIAAPTLVVWGELDAYCPRSEQDGLLAAVPGARLIVHEGAGHAFHWEDPERFAAELTAFAEEATP
jgi:pimeloyl-ACP methyl ester carboxylesterase